MRVSISVTNYSWDDLKELDEVVRTADETGIDTVWVADHLLQADPFADPAHTEHLEALTTLGYLAARTERVRLGTMVACTTFRPPAVLIKAISTLAALSGGRAWFGVGAGHQDDEARAMGLPFPSTPQRFEHLEDTLRLARQMWAGDETPFEGRHFRLERPLNSPNPAVRPRILVGGAGERRTLPLVARYADACNLFDIPDGGATVRHKLAVLASLCEAEGRPFDEIEKTISTRLQPGETAESFAERCSGFADLGVGHVVVITHGPWTPSAIEVVAQV
ncbi:LLM class F420-dependent oxidoreductase [Lentzea sp. NBRC 105346]|uniref:TIGR03560 family F420-dependent LLM class oxidoreductase n=1 Tax=Lentzea sp. NBRC 105346 TaxID=3032205 RepID=UPI0024A5C2B1|nr:TIGR03560 family F420-dependent LLM class oxidoreductase [Lentzea sp. NBRC 105346]GLZ28463.1 LLM class F420-dependent oxidoreductase [Lentzea sp. NBRC 105346]